MKDINKIKILCVDDEPNIVASLARQLSKEFIVTTANSGEEGLKLFQEIGPFPIVISDMKMPTMDGAKFLSKIRELDSDSVRILLTGQADLESAIAAVNEGQIFRFLTKPCDSNTLNQTLKMAQKQYELITSEKVLLEQTLQGSIKTLADILSLANPELFSMIDRIKVMLNIFLTELKVDESWPIKIAAVLSQIGVITLPDDTIQKIRNNFPLDPQETIMVTNLPQTSERLLSHIPRLEAVREIVLFQEKHYDGSGFPNINKKGLDIPLGSRILKILIDYDKLLTRGIDSNKIFSTLSSRKGYYDEKLLIAFTSLFKNTFNTIAEKRDVSVLGIQPGMILAEDLYTQKNILLARKGLVITPALLERIINVEKQEGIKGEIIVNIPKFFKSINQL